MSIIPFENTALRVFMVVKRLQIGCLLLLLTACQAFSRPDTQATLRAENAGYLIESTSIAQTAQAEAVNLQTTVVAAEATLTLMNNIQQQLMATARVAIPPTPQIAGANVVAAGLTEIDGLRFVDVGTSSSVRDSDGCADTLQSEFSMDAQRIYVVARARNILAGTLMGVEWSYQGTIVHQEDFVVPDDDGDYCLWFNIDPATVSFSPGGWVVRLYANESPVEPEVPFTIGG